MTGWVVLIAFLLAPLACWALLARTKILGWTFAMVFAAYAATEGILAPGWLFGSERLWLVPGLAVMSVVALAVGAALENRELDAAERPWTGRNVAGGCLASLYGIAVIGGVVILVMLAGSEPLATPTLPVDVVMPLGPGLAVTQHDTSCVTDRDPECEATFTVTSTSGLPGSAVVERVESQLTQVHGWHLSSGTGCRELNGQLVFVQIGLYDNVAMVNLESSLDPDDIGCE